MSAPVNYVDKYATILRFVISYIFAPIAAKYGLDATQTGDFKDAIFAFLAALATLAPMVYNLVTRPSSAAMQVAVEADKVMAGEKDQVVVKTPVGVPDVVITNKNANIGHS